MATIQYTVTEGERWDNVSSIAYGTPFEIQRLIKANPNVPIQELIPGGTVLELPVIDESIVADKSLLPPWKR